ncbi:MAG TPA: preprotein translocase subunit SecE [Longimicrobiales bacterium]|nr:preprotein translocase subunit SecE [Longimicrobiales bacterium]
MAAVEKIRQTRTFLEECWAELQKVTWPDKDQLRNATLVVIVFTVAISVVIWLMDTSANALIRSIMGLFGA